MEWIFIPILLIALGFSVYGNLVSLTKIENYEKLYVTIRNEMTEMLNSLNQIDNQGIFRGEDEVGYFFDSLKGIILRLNKYIVDVPSESIYVNREEEK